MPYSEELLAQLPAYCTEGRDMWMAICPLINWEMVELHLPVRTLRQFGLHQIIPQTTDTDANMHKVTRLNSCGGTDWTQKHQAYIILWDNRGEFRDHGSWSANPLMPSVEYMDWYRQRTVLYITNPNYRLDHDRIGYASQAS